VKVFISWSGNVSRAIADLLHEYLPYVVQSLKPFVSSVDIRTGARWSDVVAHELKDSEYGIVCLTPYNISKPWINFEAGALSNAIGRSYVSPILFNVKPAHIQGPLSQFQAASWNESGIYSLLSSINNRLAQQEQLDEERLHKTFKV